MSLRGLFVRFAVIYLLLLVAASVVLSLLNVKSSSASATAALLCAVMWACLWFARANKRYFTASEKRRVILGMLAIDMSLQMLIAVVLLPKLSGSLLMAMLLGVAFIAALHAAVIWFFVGFSEKQFAREIAANGG